MKLFGHLMLALGLLVGAVAPTVADEPDSLFINLTTDDAHRAKMAIVFGSAQMERGHPLTVFLNDKGVLLGAKSNAEKYAFHQKALAELAEKGATLIICPMCMKHYEVSETDLIGGLQVGNPDLTGGALFKDDTTTLTW